MKNRFKIGVVLTMFILVSVSTIQTSVLAEDVNVGHGDKNQIIAYGADVTAPVFNSVSIDKTEAIEGDIVTITVDAVDERDSELMVRVSYTKPITQRGEGIVLIKNADGKYVGNYQVTNEAEAGLWKIDNIIIEDDNYNRVILYNQYAYPNQLGNVDLSNCDFTVSGTNGADVTAPVFNSVSIDKTEAIEGDIVTITVDAVDERDSELMVRVSYTKPITQRGEGIVLIKNADGKYVGNYQVTNEAEAGLWKIDNIIIEDDNYNRVILYNQYAYPNQPGNVDLSNCDFTVSGTNGADVTAPVFNSVSIDKTEAIEGDIVTITVDAVDERDSELMVRVSYTKPITQRGEGIVLIKNADGKYVGNYQVTNEAEAGLWKIDNIIIEDDNYNRVILYNQYAYPNQPGNVDLSNCDFTVSGTNGADVTAPVFNSVSIDKTEAIEGDIVTITVDAVDERDSELMVRVSYTKPITQRGEGIVLIKNADGKYVGSYQVTNEAEAGLWKIDNIIIEDDNYNRVILYNQYAYPNQPGNVDLSNCDFTVRTTGLDVLTPVFKSITLDKTSVVNSDIITMTAEATDDQDEMISIQVFFRSPATKCVEDAIELTKNEKNQYTGIFQIDNLTENGIWKIDHLELKDDSNNTKILYNQNIYQNFGENYLDFSKCDFTVGGTDGEGTVAEIPDSNLLRALNAALGRALTPTAEIMQEDLAGLTDSLDLRFSIKSIVGLEYCTGITGLDLTYNNELTEIRPIANLTNLRTLKLYGVPVVDTSILSNLTRLTNLEIGSSQINDISFLSGLTNLKELKLADSQVTNLDILSNLSNLESLSLSNNYYLTEINSLSSLPQLSKLELIRNEQLTDLSALLNLSSLTSFKCRYSPFFDINLLTNATNLEEIEINENQLSDISILSNFPQLSVLNLWGNQIADISPLSNLTALTELNLYHNRITNISALENLKNITSLNLQEQQLTLPIIQCNGGSVASDNPVIGLDGLPVEPVVSSEIGEYNKLTNKIEWKNIPEYVKNEQFSFLVDVPIGEYGSNFSGTITQPIMGSGTLVEIPDATLKTKLNQALGVSNLDTEITQEQLKSLTGTLNLNYSGNDRIKTIEGLEYCTNITGLMLQAGDVSDLTPLAGLTGLETLDLSMNQISDISPLKDMIMLKDLNLNFNSISNLETISNFKNLESLQIVVNSVSDLTPLAGLINLKTLFLDHNEVNDLTPLANLINLKSLSFGNTEIRDLSILKNLNSLESLSVSDNNISDISVLKEKTKLRSLTLRNNNISDIGSLSSCTALEALYLGNNKISDVSALRDLNSLQHLDLNGNQIKDISSLTGKTELTWLFLGSNQINDISPILSSDKIEWLTLGPQSLTLPPAKVSYGGAISIENRLIGLDGSVITPGTISAGGTYNVALNNIVWNNVNSNAILTYDFDKDIVIGDSKASFSGIVSQPVEIASDPPSGPSTPSPIPAPNIDDVKAIDEINKAQEGAVVDVPIRNNEPLPVTILETLKGRDINVVFEFENYSWTINGKSITDLPEDIKSYDLSVKTIDDPELGELANGEDVLQIEISHNGEFPFVGQLTYNVDPSLNGKTVYRYYYDEVLKKLVFQDKTIVKDGKVTFYFEHASKYVITDIDQLKDAIIECSYQTHVQNIGWQGFKKNGDLSGTTGQSLRLEGIEIKIHGSENLTVEYKTHVQNIGWQDFVSNGKTSGTTGKSLRLEAIQIKLTGSDSENYDIYYQVHAQNIGWLDWAKNGESSGTEGLSYRLECMRIIVLPKGSTAPGITQRPFIKK